MLLVRVGKGGRGPHVYPAGAVHVGLPATCGASGTLSYNGCGDISPEATSNESGNADTEESAAEEAVAEAEESAEAEAGAAEATVEATAPGPAGAKKPSAERGGLGAALTEGPRAESQFAPRDGEGTGRPDGERG